MVRFFSGKVDALLLSSTLLNIGFIKHALGNMPSYYISDNLLTTVSISVSLKPILLPWFTITMVYYHEEVCEKYFTLSFTFEGSKRSK